MNTFSQPSGGALAKNRLILGEFPATVSSGEVLLSSINLYIYLDLKQF